MLAMGNEKNGATNITENLRHRDQEMLDDLIGLTGTIRAIYGRRSGVAVLLLVAVISSLSFDLNVFGVSLSISPAPFSVFILAFPLLYHSASQWVIKHPVMGALIQLAVLIASLIATYIALIGTSVPAY